MIKCLAYIHGAMEYFFLLLEESPISLDDLLGRDFIAKKKPRLERAIKDFFKFPDFSVFVEQKKDSSLVYFVDPMPKIRYVILEYSN